MKAQPSILPSLISPEKRKGGEKEWTKTYGIH